jgi:hypothetical protein
MLNLKKYYGAWFTFLFKGHHGNMMGFDKVLWFVFKCARDSYVTFELL